VREEAQVDSFEETPNQLGAGRSCSSSDDDVNTFFFAETEKSSNRVCQSASDGMRPRVRELLTID
jgi:hypothetical protein